MAGDNFFYLVYLESGFLSVAYLAVANLARIGISVHCQVSIRSQYLVRLLSLCWITDGHTMHPPLKGLLPPTGIETTPFRNLVSKLAGLQVHSTTPGYTHCHFLPELHLRLVGFTYSVCGPFTKHLERIQKFRETGNLKHVIKINYLFMMQHILTVKIQLRKLVQIRL